MFVVEEKMRPLALDHRADRTATGCAPAPARRRRRSPASPAGPMLLLAGALERDRHQLPAAHPRLDQAPDRGLARRIEMADRIQADDALRAQARARADRRSISRAEAGFRRLVPAEMPRHQLIGLEHAVALGDREPAFVERQLQRPLRRLAAGPQMLLVHQHVVVDVADGQRAVPPDQPHHLAQIRRLDRARTTCGPRAGDASWPE